MRTPNTTAENGSDVMLMVLGAGFAEQMRGGRGGSSTRGAKAAQKSCKTTLTSGGRSQQHDEHLDTALARD